MGPATIYLVDSYDTLEGTRKAASLGKPMWGVRLDSGNLLELTGPVRTILDEAGLPEAKIMVTGDLNEYKILELVKENLPIDAFGVGTELATSADAPNLGAVYKLVELEAGGVTRYTAKLSEDKHTLPGAKQVFRYPDRDVVGCAWEKPNKPAGAPFPESLLQPVMLSGELVKPLPDVHSARERASDCLKKLPSACRSLFPADPPYPVEYSNELQALYDKTRSTLEGSAS